MVDDAQVRPFCSAGDGPGTTIVYLLDDRVEVGHVAFGWNEELRRVAYRDVTAVTTWRTRRPRRLVVGGVFLAFAVVTIVGMLVGTPTWGPAAFAVVSGAIGSAFLYAGRDGTAMRFRVVGAHGTAPNAVVGGDAARRRAGIVSRRSAFVEGVVLGRARQERFVAELLTRIEERRRGPRGAA